MAASAASFHALRTLLLDGATTLEFATLAKRPVLITNVACA